MPSKTKGKSTPGASAKKKAGARASSSAKKKVSQADVDDLSEGISTMMIEGRIKGVELRGYNITKGFWILHYSWTEDGYWFVDFEVYGPTMTAEAIYAAITRCGKFIDLKMKLPARIFDPELDHTNTQSYDKHRLPKTHAKRQAKIALLQQIMEENHMDANSDGLKSIAKIPLPFKCQQQFCDSHATKVKNRSDKYVHLIPNEDLSAGIVEFDYVLRMTCKSAAVPRKVQSEETERDVVHGGASLDFASLMKEALDKNKKRGRGGDGDVTEDEEMNEDDADRFGGLDR